MLQVHHLNNSRSQRVLWLLEELELPYEVVVHQRDPQTNLSPASLRALHPLGKSPLIIDDGRPVIESAAILEYIVRRYGGGRLAPKESAPEYPRYLQLMHYAEGSAMLPLLLRLYLRRLGDAAQPLEARVSGEIENHLGYLDAELGSGPWFLGEELSAADVQLSFVFQIGRYLYGLQKFPNLVRFLAQVESRPAYLRGLQRGGGPYIFGTAPAANA